MNLFKNFFKNKKGLSLVELIATVAIMGIITAGISVAVVSASRNYSKGNSEVELQQDVQTVSNILANIIVDSKIARNTADESVAASMDVLYVLSSDGSAYQIMLSGDTLYYGKTSFNAGTRTFATLTVDKMVKLADRVNTFTADTTTYGSDYSVKFIVKLASSANNREMETTFSATSRNAGSTGSIVNVVDSATIITEVQAVIEPHNEIEINYDVLVSGLVTDTSIATPKCYSDAAMTTELPGGVVTITPTEVGSVKTLKIKASGSIADLSISKFYIKLETSASNGSIPYDTKKIEVFVRKINSVSLLGANTVVGYDSSNTEVETKYQTGAVYEISTVLDSYNGERFLGFLSDMNYPDFYSSTGNPYTVRYKFAASGGFSLEDVYVTVPGLYSNVKASTISSIDLDSRDGVKISVKLGKSMPRGSTLACIPIGLHAEYASSPTDTTALNKANTKYNYTSTPWMITPPAASIRRGQIGGSPIEGSDSTKYQRDQGWNRFVDTFYKPAMKDKYASDDTIIAKLDDETEINKIKDQNSNVNIGRFYTIGSIDRPTEPAENNNNYFWNDGSYYWSQYRLLSTDLNNPNWNLTQEMSLRMEPDVFYQLEFVDVIYTTAAITTPTGTIPANVIVWPRYDKLLELGFGRHTDGSRAGELGLSFWDEAATVTPNYDSFGENYPIYPANIQFLANSTYGVVNGSPTVGSESDPITVEGTTAVFSYNQADWKGLTYQSYQNDIGAVLQMNDGGSWVDLEHLNLNGSSTPALTTNYTSNVGGFYIHLTNTAYEIDRLTNKPDTYDKDAVFRLHVNVAAKRRYIKDADGVLSKTIYQDTNRTVYNYPDTGGFIYFHAKYPVADEMILDYNDGSGLVRNVEITNNGNSKPLGDYPTSEEINAHLANGYTFGGWYADAAFTTQIPDTSNTANSYNTYWNTTVYARWIENGRVTISLNANGGNCSQTSVTVYEGGTISLPDASLEGSTFIGWYTSASGGSRVDNNATYDSVKNYATLYARFSNGDIEDYECSYVMTNYDSYNGVKQYNLFFTNNTASHVDSMTVKIPYFGNVTSVGGNVSGVVSSDGYVYITFNNYNNGFNAGATTDGIYTTVNGTGSFGLN